MVEGWVPIPGQFFWLILYRPIITRKITKLWSKSRNRFPQETWMEIYDVAGERLTTIGWLRPQLVAVGGGGASIASRSDILNLRPSVTCLVLHHLIHRSDILNLFRYLHAQISHAQISHTQMSSIYACLSHATASSTLFIAQIWIAVFPIRAIHNLLLHAACSDILNLRPSVRCHSCTIHLIHSQM